MRLKHLQLQGYKTFATRTEFEFDNGITAIVGPNGSGKSNIADALRWVLGEQSYSTLRGKRTTDMIYAGSQSRSRAGMAQAVLTLDNSEGWLPIDYSEIEIGRRAHRSGENEYLLNGQKVRLRDVTELLSSSGLAERTYTIIGQGLIDQALSLRADERRALFEEAAGVSHYKNKRAETLRRLNETQHNLERVHDILAEIRPRLSSLKRQANRAQNYEQVAADLRYHLRIWYGFQWKQSRQNLREARQMADDARLGWEEGRKHQLALQEELDGKRRHINQLQRQLQSKRDQRETVRVALEKAGRQVAILTERRTLMERQLAEIEEDAARLEQQQQTARLEMDQALAELEKANSTLLEQQSRQAEFQTAFQQQQGDIDRCRREIERLEREGRETQNQRSQAEGRLNQLRERLAEKQKEQTAEADLDALSQSIQESEQAVQQAEEKMAQSHSALAERQKERQAFIDQIQPVRQKAAEIEQQINETNREIARLQTRRDMLDEMRRKDVQLPEDLPLVGRLASLLTIPAQYRTALEAALANRLAVVVVEKEKDLWQLVNQAGEQSLTALTAANVQPPEPLPAPDHADVIGWAAELVKADKKIQAVIQLLLGRVLLVSGNESAYELAAGLPFGSIVVTMDGRLFHAGGLVEIPAHDPQNSLLAREEAWRAAAGELEGKQAELAEREAAYRENESAIRGRQAEIEAIAEAIEEQSRRERETVQQFSEAQRNLDRLRQQQDYILRRKEADAAEVERLAGQIKALEQQITGLESAGEKITADLQAAQTRLETLPVLEAEAEQKNLKQQVATAQTIVAGRQAVVDSRRSTLNQVDERLKRLKVRRGSLRQQQEQDDPAEQQTELTRLTQETAAIEAELEPLRAKTAAVQNELEALEEQIGRNQRQSHELENRYTQAQVKLTQRENQIEGLRERIRGDLGLVALDYDDDQVGQSPLPIAEFVETLPDVDKLPEDIDETIQRYRGQLHRMGAINPDAPAEYEETNSRYEFLTQQLEDLDKTEKHLRQVIADLDDLTSRAFAETVEKVDAIFGDTFKRLFGGGSAQLVLTDPDDLTISGVDIIARLPSRREQGLALLSGGERSLTASALIFSLLRVSPTPFCVLDEVDAMLDEANINRFRDLLQELSAQTQFIIITHNRGTVQVARTIYGVSMGADSTSQVISVRPEEYINAP
jgi:chromosome segregation protein